jgi:hypothetical protein
MKLPQDETSEMGFASEAAPQRLRCEVPAGASALATVRKVAVAVAQRVVF